MKYVIELKAEEIDFINSLLCDYSTSKKHTAEGIKTSMAIYSKVNNPEKVPDGFDVSHAIRMDLP